MYKKKKIELIHILTSEMIDELERNEGYKENTKYNVDYFSVESDFILSLNLQDKFEIYGAHYLSFYLYLKTQMLNGGKYYIDSKTSKRVIRNYSVMYFADVENIKDIFDDLVSTKTIFVLNTETLGEIITDPYIVYNYSITMEQRLYNRLKKQEERAEDKEEKEVKDITGASAPSAPPVQSFEESFDEAFPDDFDYDLLGGMQ